MEWSIITGIDKKGIIEPSARSAGRKGTAVFVLWQILVES